MFGKLREKLKGWVKKNEEKVVEEIVETKKKANKKEATKKVNKEILKKEPQKKESSKKAKEEKERKKESKSKEVEKKTEEKPAKEKKKGFLDNLFKKKETEEEVEEVIEEESDEEIPNPEEEKTGFFERFSKKLDEEKFEEMYEELSVILIQNNVAYVAVEQIKESLKEKLLGKSLKEVNLSKELKESIKSILINPPNFLETIKDSLKENSPYVIVFAGINGSGKTTTIAKVAHYLKKNNLSVCLAAADTFRAAAIQQLEEHSNRLKIPIIKKDYGADPASVGFDAITYAKKHKIDVVLIDTAGRLQNKDSLMKEMEKITRVNKPNMKIFLGESITGNDATEQAKTFNETIDITGIILSKADVDEKGGTAISVSAVTDKPILFLGTGQNYEDLEIFDKDKMIEKLGL